MNRQLFFLVTLFVSLSSFGQSYAPSYVGIWCGTYNGRFEKLVIDENNGVKIYEGLGASERLIHGGIADLGKYFQLFIEQTPGQEDYRSRGYSDFQIRRNGTELRITYIDTQQEVTYSSICQ